MFNNKYGDEGLTELFSMEVSKSSIELDFLGDLKEVNAYIKLSLQKVSFGLKLYLGYFALGTMLCINF